MIERLFSLRQDEISKALPFLGLLVCLFTGVTLARNLAMSLVVAEFGKEALPLLFALIGVFQLFFALLYALLSVRIATQRLYCGLLLVLGLFCLICMLLLLLDLRLASALLYVGLFVLLPVVVIHDGTHLATYLNSHEQKKLAGFIAAGIPLGAMLGGALLLLLLRILPPVWLLLTLPVSAALTLGMVVGIARQRVALDDSPSVAPPATPLMQMKAGMSAVTGVPLLKWLAAGVFVATLLQQFMVYFYQGIIYPAEFPDVAERAAFFGKYDLILNFLALLFQLLLASRLITRLGVGLSSLVHPLLYLGSSVILLATQGLWAGIISQAVNQELRTYFRKPVDNLLFNGMSSRLWGMAKAFLGGVVQPLAILLSTLVLLLLQGLPEALLLSLLKGMLFLLALLGVLLVIPQSRAYDQGVLDLLKKRGLPRERVQQLPAELVAAQALVLLKRSRPDEILFGLELLRQIRRPDDLPAVLVLMGQTEDPLVIEACIECLDAFPGNESAFQALFRVFCRNPTRHGPDHYSLQHQALAALTRFDRPELIPKVLALMADPEIPASLFGRAALYLSSSQHFGETGKLRQDALTLLQASDAELRHQALEILIRTGSAEDGVVVAALLADDDAQVRAAALHCLAALETASCVYLQSGLLAAMRDRQSLVRLEAVKLVGNMKQQPDSVFLAALLPLLADPAPRVASQVRMILTNRLEQLAPLLESALFTTNAAFAQCKPLMELLLTRQDDAFKKRLEQACMQALGRVLLYESIRPAVAGEADGALGDFLQKHLQQLARDALQFSLLGVVLLSGGDSELFQRINRGMLSAAMRDQGLALDALSRLRARGLAEWVIRVVESRNLPQANLAILYQALTARPLLLQEPIWQQLEQLDEPYLRAAAWLLGRQGEPTDLALRHLLVEPTT